MVRSRLGASSSLTPIDSNSSLSAMQYYQQLKKVLNVQSEKKGIKDARKHFQKVMKKLDKIEVSNQRRLLAAQAATTYADTYTAGTDVIASSILAKNSQQSGSSQSLLLNRKIKQLKPVKITTEPTVIDLQKTRKGIKQTPKEPIGKELTRNHLPRKFSTDSVDDEISLHNQIKTRSLSRKSPKKTINSNRRHANRISLNTLTVGECLPVAPTTRNLQTNSTLTQQSSRIIERQKSSDVLIR